MSQRLFIACFVLMLASGGANAAGFGEVTAKPDVTDQSNCGFSGCRAPGANVAEKPEKALKPAVAAKSTDKKSASKLAAKTALPQMYGMEPEKLNAEAARLQAASMGVAQKNAATEPVKLKPSFETVDTQNTKAVPPVQALLGQPAAGNAASPAPSEAKIGLRTQQDQLQAGVYDDEADGADDEADSVTNDSSVTKKPRRRREIGVVGATILAFKFWKLFALAIPVLGGVLYGRKDKPKAGAARLA